MKASVVAAASLFALASAKTKCDPASLNTTVGYYYYGEANVTVAEIAKKVNRGLCDFGRWNLMADVTILPNVGQNFSVPAEVCEPDNTSCLVPDTPTNASCVIGGPRNYITVNGDTLNIIAQRFAINASYLLPTSHLDTVTEVIPQGTSLKIPLCYPSYCIIQPYVFDQHLVFKDLAGIYNVTVGQLVGYGGSYNYSTGIVAGESGPTLNIPTHCQLLTSDYTVLS